MKDKKNKIGKYFPSVISKKQASDTGMAIMLILFIVAYFTNDIIYIKISFPILLINMIYPMLFYPIAVVWLGLSTLLGTIVSKIILTFVFSIMVVPVGLFRRLIGKDTLQLYKFKNDTNSVMKKRNYKFSSKDLEKPF